MSIRFKGMVITVIVAAICATLLYYGIDYMKGRTTTHSDEAIATNIDQAILNAPIVIMGIVADGKGEPRNLRRDLTDPTKEDARVVVPGTDYNVTVTQVLKGNLEIGSRMKIAIGGGNHKSKKAPLRATVLAGVEYIFTIAPSSSGAQQYYGIIEPFIYQFKDNRVVAISNIEKYKAAFQETEISEADFLDKFK